MAVFVTHIQAHNGGVIWGRSSDALNCRLYDPSALRFNPGPGVNFTSVPSAPHNIIKSSKFIATCGIGGDKNKNSLALLSIERRSAQVLRASAASSRCGTQQVTLFSPNGTFPYFSHWLTKKTHHESLVSFGAQWSSLTAGYRLQTMRAQRMFLAAPRSPPDAIIHRLSLPFPFQIPPSLPHGEPRPQLPL